MPRDHPRSRGVYSWVILCMRSSTGSSPLARGLRIMIFSCAWARRIIPARAGFTAQYVFLFHHLRDHPRSRGVYRAGNTHHRLLRGSSPLARGLLSPSERGGALTRIIPARAGFTALFIITRSPRPDHPRSRGVYPTRPSRPWSSWGSSPLARGLPEDTMNTTIIRGIIPARAGFTRRPRADLRPGADHPRSRGVYREAFEQQTERTGSSPLARGLRFLSLSSGAVLDHPRSRGVYVGYAPEHDDAVRIIPARAGFTKPSIRARIRARDHPRSRGVYAMGPCTAMRARGSSPLARGLLRAQYWRDVLRWIIPARAGFTARARRPDRRSGDHPRSRGVYKYVPMDVLLE